MTVQHSRRSEHIGACSLRISLTFGLPPEDFLSIKLTAAPHVDLDVHQRIAGCLKLKVMFEGR